MDTIKILHCADLHIGFDFAFLGRRAAARRAELLQTLRTIASLCIKEGVHLLLIAGDLFDSVRVPEETQRTVAEILAEIPETGIAIAPGNHDPLTPDSPYLREALWPASVRILKDPRESCVFADLPVRLWGAGFTAPYCRQTLLPCAAGFGEEDGRIQICVQHGDVVGNGQSSDYNPLTPADLAQSGMDYIALGHVHKRSEVLRAGRTWYAYSGTPEGHGFDEQGPKGVYLGTVARGACDLTFRETGRRRFEALSVDVSGADGSLAAARLVKDALHAAFGDTGGEHLYKVQLTGTVGENVRLNADTMRAALGDDVYFLKLRDKTELAEEAEPSPDTLRGRFVRLMRARIEQATKEEERERLRLALQLGLKALADEVTYHAD